MDRINLSAYIILFVYIIFFIISLILVWGLVDVLFSPSIKILDECENRAWDGLVYETGVKKINLFTEAEGILVKCNKGEGTDEMIEILNSLRNKNG